MEGRHSAKKSGLEYLKFWRLDSGFHDSRILLLVPSSSHGSVLLRTEGEEGPAGRAARGHELHILLDGIWLALPAVSGFDLHRLDSR